MSDVSIGLEFDTNSKTFKYWRDGQEFDGNVKVDHDDKMRISFTPMNPGWTFEGCFVTPKGGAPPECVTFTVSPLEVRLTDDNTNATNKDQVYDYALQVKKTGQTLTADPQLINRPGGL